ncbi:MAG: hypothetical protein PF572_06085 [Patescibacteria group bacterium]|jgi:hypothetical protein|nr:hypothetical protein [Patescibacteria group bacterium]
MISTVHLNSIIRFLNIDQADIKSIIQLSSDRFKIEWYDGIVQIFKVSIAIKTKNVKYSK